jgi:ferritin
METTTQKDAEKCYNFVCELCDFKCCKESNYKKHLETNKHNRLHQTTKKMPSHESKDFICICGNKYRHHTSLAKHKRNCGNKTIIDDEKTDTSLASELKEMATKDKDGLILKLLKDNEEIRQILKDIIPKIGNNTIINNNNNSNNTTNNFNLNVFLNEQCKDALNISEFVDSLKITFEDLLYSKKNGLVEGISNVMIRGLKELDIYKRPIHCTDKKRETMYIKDHEKWEKDETHEIMRNTIEKIADKERTALQLWTEENPDWIETERKQMEYLTMLRNISEPIEDEAKNGKKIIRAVSREVIVDKKDMDI